MVGDAEGLRRRKIALYRKSIKIRTKRVKIEISFEDHLNFRTDFKVLTPSPLADANNSRKFEYRCLLRVPGSADLCVVLVFSATQEDLCKGCLFDLFASIQFLLLLPADSPSFKYVLHLFQAFPFFPKQKMINRTANRNNFSKMMAQISRRYSYLRSARNLAISTAEPYNPRFKTMATNIFTRSVATQTMGNYKSSHLYI